MNYGKWITYRYWGSFKRIQWRLCFSRVFFSKEIDWNVYYYSTWPSFWINESTSLTTIFRNHSSKQNFFWRAKKIMRSTIKEEIFLTCLKFPARSTDFTSHNFSQSRLKKLIWITMNLARHSTREYYFHSNEFLNKPKLSLEKMREKLSQFQHCETIFVALLELWILMRDSFRLVWD